MEPKKRNKLVNMIKRKRSRLTDTDNKLVNQACSLELAVWINSACLGLPPKHFSQWGVKVCDRIGVLFSKDHSNCVGKKNTSQSKQG